jgi:hypothetical protein
MRAAIVLGMAMALSAPVFAQQGEKPAASCAAMDASLPAELHDWNGKAPLATVSKADDLAKADIGPATGYEATLARTVSIKMPVQPEKPGGSVAFAGLFSFTIPEAGNYAVALGAAAWIDVLEDGKAVAPASFGHGPECTSIRKIVVFPLKAGRHILQVSASADAKLKLMVAKKP